MTDDIRDAAYHFEAVKIALRQDKTGYILNLSVHPNDITEALLRDPVGSRYMVALVRLGDDDQPVVGGGGGTLGGGERGGERGKRDRLVAVAGVICRNPEFQTYLSIRLGVVVNSEADAVAGLKTLLDMAGAPIKSRSELANNDAARRAFQSVLDQFEEHVRR